jgi:hypothetical protein
MRPALDHRTVSLWPVAASPKSSGSGQAGDAKVAEATAKTGDPATEALAAITSSYQHGREGIISGQSPPSVGQHGENPQPDLALAHPPTVPLTLVSNPKPAEPAQAPPTGQPRALANFWSRLVWTRRSAPRGRHSPKC